MIFIHLNGRLGNQLFQYAFAIALSRRLNTFYIVDDKDTPDSVKKYFEPISIVDNNYLRRILKKLFNNNRLVIEQTGFEELEADNSFAVDSAYYKGFFQSERYSKIISSDLNGIFRIKKKYKVLFQEKYSGFFEQNKTVIIHCRIGDYALWGSELLGGANMVLPTDYYKNALQLVQDLASYKIIVVTDDIKGAENKFSFIEEKILISDQEIIDFQLLMYADKLIISNSTFAWWAALLNVKKAQVFAPEFWLGFKVRKEYPNGIVHSRFEKVSF